jgi:hypothetical protein
MTQRSESLATRVQQANDALLAAVEHSTAEQWQARCADGDWTQGFSGYHAGASIGNITGMVQAMADGQPFAPVTFDQIDQMNAEFPSQHADCTKDETLGLIRQNGPASVAFVRGLSDEKLDRKVSLAVGLPEMSVEQVIEMLLVGHPAGHVQSILNARCSPRPRKRSRGTRGRDRRTMLRVLIA